MKLQAMDGYALLPGYGLSPVTPHPPLAPFLARLVQYIVIMDIDNMHAVLPHMYIQSPLYYALGFYSFILFYCSIPVLLMDIVHHSIAFSKVLYIGLC